MRVHHAAATSYIDQCIGSAIEKIVEQLVGKIAAGVVDVLGATDVQATGQQLIGSFLEPAAAGIADKAQESEADARLAAAAHDTLGGAMEDVTKYSSL